nr:MAG TPA: hypothetical protein [Caudoviricetes sp.]
MKTFGALLFLALGTAGGFFYRRLAGTRKERHAGRLTRRTA